MIAILKGKKIQVVIILLTAFSITAVVLFLIAPKATYSSPALTPLELINLTNQERNRYQLAPLAVNYQLTKAAEAKAEAILQADNFSHQPDGQKKFSAWVPEDYHYLRVGENLAMGFASPEAVIKAWMLSDKHRANILDPKYREIGLTVVRGELAGEKTYLIVQYFGVTPNIIISENLLPYQKMMPGLKHLAIMI